MYCMVGNPGELAELSIKCAACAQKAASLHGTNLCKELRSVQYVDVCKLHWLCNSMRRRRRRSRRVGNAGAVSMPGAATSTHSLRNPLSLSLTCTYFHSRTFLTQISHIHNTTTRLSTNLRLNLCLSIYYHFPFPSQSAEL